MPVTRRFAGYGLNSVTVQALQRSRTPTHHLFASIKPSCCGKLTAVNSAFWALHSAPAVQLSELSRQGWPKQLSHHGSCSAAGTAQQPAQHFPCLKLAGKPGHPWLERTDLEGMTSNHKKYTSGKHNNARPSTSIMQVPSNTSATRRS